MVSSFRNRLAINSSKAGAYGMKHGCLSPEGGNNRELEYLRFTFVFDGIQVIAGLDTRKNQ